MNMEQIKAFIEKANTDSELMAKLDALGKSGAGAEEVVALASEYGFIFTAQEYEEAVKCGGNCARCGELSEEDLDAVAGGAEPTINRYDANMCRNLVRNRKECIGPLRVTFWCDHYTVYMQSLWDGGDYNHKCAMGAFEYIGDKDGNPKAPN